MLYLKSLFPKTYITNITVTYDAEVLIHREIKFGSNFWKWPSPNDARFLKSPPSGILRLHAYIIEINIKRF